MSSRHFVTPEPIKQVLQSLQLPDLTAMSLYDCLAGLNQSDESLSVNFTFGYPCESQLSHLRTVIGEALAPFANNLNLELHCQPPSVVANSDLKAIAGVKNIIAVASGKGGVGKSTTSVNLALALSQEGAQVGVLDADIYGPSQSLMLGVQGQRPEMYSTNQMKPIIGLGGIKMMSMGNLVTENTPMVWRGPMVSGALQQLLNQTHWGNLDYLIVDMPPGTGDIQLTLSQSVPVSGAVVVTTPQDIALLDARKGVEMFQKVNIPVLGVVENMSLYCCSQCGHEEAIFGTQGGDQLAEEYHVALLGRLPLQRRICELTDQGTPPVFSEPDSDVAEKYRGIARAATAQLWMQAIRQPRAPVFGVVDE